MIWLTGHLLGVLALTAIVAGFAGWCWHAWRHADAAQALEAEKAKLRADLMRRARLDGALSAHAPAAEDDADAQDEQAFLRHSAQRQAERVAQLERELASVRAENDQAELLRLENADLRAALQARDGEFHQSDALLARIAQLEDALAQAPEQAHAAVAHEVPAAAIAEPPTVDSGAEAALRWRALYFERRAFHQAAEHAQALAALEAPVSEPENDPEQEQVTQWRLRYFSARAAYLEKRLAELEAPASDGGAPKALVGLGGEEADEHARRQSWRLTYMDRRLESFAEQAREAVGAAESGAQALAGRLAARENEAAALAARVDAAQEEAFIYLARAETAEAAHVALQARVSELDSEIGALRQSLQDAQAELAAEPKEDGEKTRLRWKASYLEMRVRQLEGEAFSASTQAQSPPVAGLVTPQDGPTDTPVNVAAVVAPAAPSAPAKPVPSMAVARPKRLAAPRGGAPDDLRLIPGVTPQIESKLNASGIFHFDQIADWTAPEANWIDQYLAMRGQIERDNWIEQAGRLARGEAALQFSAT